MLIKEGHRWCCHIELVDDNVQMVWVKIVTGLRLKEDTCIYSPIKCDPSVRQSINGEISRACVNQTAIAMVDFDLCIDFTHLAKVL